jgi:hypothetical protein
MLREPGRPLDESTRAFFEPRFGRDLGQVRLHTGEDADQAARALGARAFTSGREVAFSRGVYDTGSAAGRRLLAHELTHTIQQRAAGGPRHIQRTFRPDELMDASGAPRRSNPVASSPDAHFHPGTVGPRPGRRAVVIAGIHGSERSARELGHAAEAELGAGSQRPYFHTVVVPQANPAPRTDDRGAGSGATRVQDLNREFGTGYTSPSPYAQQLTTLVEEFDPERILSVHAIGTASLGGIFLDPIHQRLPAQPDESGRDVDIRSYPPVSTPAERAAAFTGDPRNRAAMELTESMVAAVSGPGTTSGNRPTRRRPASLYPPTGAGGTTASSSSLIYPRQSSMSGGVSLGTWASGHERTVVTIEIPGYRAPRTTWQRFLPAVWRFLAERPGAAPAAPAAGTAGSADSDEQ